MASLSPNEVFELVHEVGFEDAQPLLELATPAQFQGCLDLDGWAKAEIELGRPEGAEAKRWRDVWSAGQGVGAVRAIEQVGHIVDDLAAEYEAAKG